MRRILRSECVMLSFLWAKVLVEAWMFIQSKSKFFTSHFTMPNKM